MPEKAKVFIAEDDDSTRELERRILTGRGHTIELEAISLEEALQKIKFAKGLGVNVLVSDGCLAKGDWQDHGKIIAEALKKEIPDIKIVSFSSMPVEWGDTHARKPEDIMKLGDIVTEL